MLLIPLKIALKSCSFRFFALFLFGTYINQQLIRINNVKNALEISENHYRAIVENTSDLICRFLPDTTLTYVNRSYCNYFGRTDQELIGRKFLELIPEEAHEGVRAEIATIISTKKEVSHEHEVIAPDGQLRWQAWTDQPIVDQDGNVVEFQSIGRDITSRKLQEVERETLIKKLETQNTELERFTYTVSHDLKSPLITIGGFLGYLEEDISKDNSDRVGRDIQRIREAVEKMQRLLNELLELSRIGRLMNPPETISFETIVHEALALVSGQLEARQIQVVVDAKLPNVYGDRSRLIEIVQNLVDNSAKFMGNQPTPKIEVSIRRDKDETIFFVKDNGIGIEPQYHEKIFGLFERLNPSVEGTGIGLTLVKRIVEVHGGRIWVESGGRGMGATFCFTLPVKPQSQLIEN